jgi:hypothetical protein
MSRDALDVFNATLLATARKWAARHTPQQKFGDRIPIPAPEFTSIKDPIMREQLREAWAAAARLIAAIRIWEWLLKFARDRIRLSAADHAFLLREFPDLPDARRFLKCFAQARRCDRSDTSDVEGFLESLSCMIKKQARVLAAHGIPNTLRRRLARTTRRETAALLGVKSQEAVERSLAGPAEAPPKQLFGLLSPLAKFLQHMEEAPASVLRPLRRVPALGISADVSAGTVTLTGQSPFVVGTEAAAVVRVLCDAQGDWRSNREMVATEKQLVGTRIDRVIKKLPIGIRNRIESKPGKGYRLLPNVVT